MLYILYISGGVTGASLHSISDSHEKAKEYVNDFTTEPYSDNPPVNTWWICKMPQNSKLTDSVEVERVNL